MRTAGFAVASQQGLFIRLDERQRNRMIFLEMLQKRRQFLELQALARVHQQGCSGEVAFACGMKFRKNGYEIDRKVVHAVEAHILKGPQHGAFPGAGGSGEDDQLARVLSRRRLHRKAAQLFTRRWCVLGMRISSRYFATVRRVTWMPASSSFCAMCSSVSGLDESSSSIIFFTNRFKVSRDIPPPSGPFTDSLKKDRSSSTPCEVCAYLLATARLTLEGCTPTSSPTSLLTLRRNASRPWS